MVEHAIVLPFFFFLLLVTVEFFRVMYNQISMQFALTEASRWALVQDTVVGTDIRTAVQNRLQSVGASVAATDVLTICPIAQFPTCAKGTLNPGGPDDLIVYQLDRRTGLLGFPGSSIASFEIHARVFARNEPQR